MREGAQFVAAVDAVEAAAARHQTGNQERESERKKWWQEEEGEEQDDDSSRAAARRLPNLSPCVCHVRREMQREIRHATVGEEHVAVSEFANQRDTCVTQTHQQQQSHAGTSSSL